jgi:hypothetical protein
MKPIDLNKDIKKYLGKTIDELLHLTPIDSIAIAITAIHSPLYLKLYEHMLCNLELQITKDLK